MKSLTWTASAVVLAGALAAAGTAQTRASGGTATYWMSAETMSGFGATASQGGRPNIAALMSGGGASQPDFVHNLTLQLASPRRAAAPSAEHLVPAGLGAGPSLPLLTPQSAPATTPNPSMPGVANGGVQGRILFYWGCGDHARPGQPVELDLSRLTAGRPAPTGVVIAPMSPPSAGAAVTYGDWPNQRGRTTVPAIGSLVGDHVIRGNYSPEIRFALAQGQDFLAPVNVTSNSASGSGAVPLAWQPVANARGYFAMATGAREDGTIVMWSSSEIQLAQPWFDYLAPEEVARLVQQRVLLAPQTTQCTVPAEVAGSVQAASLMLNAFGPEANFSYPARPANAPRSWAPDWTVKLRTRSAYMGMLGMDMAAMMRGESAEESPREQPQQRRRGLRLPLGRILGQ